MDYSRMLMQPFTPGRNVSEERWELAFGKRKDGLNEELPPKDGVYERRVKEALEKQSESRKK